MMEVSSVVMLEKSKDIQMAVWKESKWVTL